MSTPSPTSSASSSPRTATYPAHTLSPNSPYTSQRPTSTSAGNATRVSSHLGVARAWDSPSHSPPSSASSYNELEHEEVDARSVVRFEDVERIDLDTIDLGDDLHHHNRDTDSARYSTTSAARRATVYQSRHSAAGGYDGERPVHGVTILTSDYDEVDALLHSIYEKTQQDAWFAPPPNAGAVADASLGGVALRVAAGVVGASMGVTSPAANNGANGADTDAPNVVSGTSTPNGTNTAGNQSEFRIFPYHAPHLIPFEAAVRALNPAGAVLVRNAAVTAAVGRVPASHYSLNLDAETRIQVLARLADLPGAEKDQCGAFIRAPPSLVLWAPQVESLVPLAAEFEEKLFKYIWRTRGAALPSTGAPVRDSLAAPGVLGSLFGAASGAVSNASGARSEVGASGVEEVEEGEGSTAFLAPRQDQTTTKERDDFNETAQAPATAAPSKKPTTLFGWSWRLQPRAAPPTTSNGGGDAEKVADAESGGGEGGKERKLVLLGPLYAGCGAALAAYFCLSGLSVLLEEYALDHDPTRFALLVTLPVIFCVSIFFCLQLVGNISLIIGPVSQYHENSAFYSAVKPAPNPAVDNALPHITIQCPVYKESLKETIAPSVLSVKKAMQTYARQGGTSAIFICDDGMQLISEEDRQERMAFYANHNIGWTARPGHGRDGFVRKGKFKKASNMNFGLALSLKLEKHLAALEAAGVSEDDGECLEDKAMHLAVEETYEESGRKYRPWACNGKSLRVGEIILIIDSDTIVPEDCFRDAAREMYESPDLAIIQHESDVMQVAHHYFENGITHFTRRINRCISYGCANGEVAPFVGHNAFLRWSAVQDAAFDDPDDGKRKQWSESNVSEDFDLALRLLLGGYTLRWATYSDGGFKEGVSLTVQDELARWQKYAYGCDEIIFNPLIRWWRSGPISQQLRGFVWSIAPVHYKIGMMSYMFSYYGIAAATVGSILNYLLLGLAPELDRFYLKSFEILLACTVVFPGLGNLGFTLLEYRLGHRNFFTALIENLRWVPFFLFFFGGLSIHLSTAILAHLFSYDMTWGSTVKEVERSTFWIEVPLIWKRFKLSFIICFAVIVMMIVFTSKSVPFDWQIQGWNWALNIPLSLVVGCHILLPIVLNPWLMIFSY
ncbi:glycosyl transferase family group 2-domain-containing protein [Mycena alexandri]|uniref:Glycosyl transferase family group 2-domain-containing protein n=1 Tax=Mycena alexandri TaxID=1745969 RepID=A0AAD6SS14_9AGAR|nr:glycosyl transferase family group 2-domain-containing protein [Mycena alexandri]